MAWCLRVILHVQFTLISIRMIVRCALQVGKVALADRCFSRFRKLIYMKKSDLFTGVMALGIACLLSSVVGSVEVGPQERALMEEIVVAQQDRHKLYGNMHAVWTETDIDINGNKTVKRIEFWSREQKYYRVDYEQVVGESTAYRIIRELVLPERYVRLFAQEREELGDVFKRGAVSDGIKVIKGFRWYCGANKALFTEVQTEITDWLDGESKFKSYQVGKQEDGSVTITSFQERNLKGGETTRLLKRTQEYRLSAGDFRVLEFHSQSNISDGGWGKVQVHNTYTNQQVDLPQLSSNEGSASDGGPTSSRFELLECHLEPSPLEIFFVDELGLRPPKQTRWFPRIFLAVNGIVLFLFYLFFRKRNKPDSVSLP